MSSQDGDPPRSDSGEAAEAAGAHRDVAPGPTSGTRSGSASDTGPRGSTLDPAQAAALIAAIATARDITAFEALFRSYFPRLRAYMLGLARDRQMAEEMVQEVMITIWRKAAQFDAARGSAPAWIFTIARNVWIDACRRQRRPAFDPADPAFVGEDAPPADSLIAARQSAEALHRALDALPPEQLEMIRLAFFDGASHRVIATRLGLPLGTVKSRIRLAFGRLRALLETGR